MDDCDWSGELTQYSWKQTWLQVLILKKHSTLENTRSLHVASWDNDGTIQIYGCKCSFEIAICLKDTRKALDDFKKKQQKCMT